MCRHATHPLPPEPASAAAARSVLRERFRAWHLDELVPDAELALTELVTNAVLHAGTPLVVSLSCADGSVEIAVFDGAPVLPSVRPHRPDLAADLDELLAVEAGLGHAPAGAHDERAPDLHVGEAGAVTGGRGLLLVDAVAAEWGVSPLSDGKAVWVRTPVPQRWPDRADCDCTGAGDVSLASGARVRARLV